jgi:hypothetical protein
MLQNLKQLTSLIGDFGLHFVLTRDNGKPVPKTIYWGAQCSGQHLET